MQEKISNLIYALITDVATHQIIVVYLVRWQRVIPLLPPFHHL